MSFKHNCSWLTEEALVVKITSGIPISCHLLGHDLLQSWLSVTALEIQKKKLFWNHKCRHRRKAEQGTRYSQKPFPSSSPSSDRKDVMLSISNSCRSVKDYTHTQTYIHTDHNTHSLFMMAFVSSIKINFTGSIQSRLWKNKINTNKKHKSNFKWTNP